MSGEVLPSVLKVISNRIRRKIVQLLSDGNMTYLELLISCGLEPDRHCGWFDYHLSVLLNEGVVKKDEVQYSLTDFGRSVAGLLTTIEGESHRLFEKEVKSLKKEETVVIQETAPSLAIREVPNGKLMISLDYQQPLWCQGEHRVYKETARVSPEVETPWGRDNYDVYVCLERTWFPKKEEYHYVILHEVYASKYDGTEENKNIVQRTEEGYFLDNWSKRWEVQGHDGLYETKRISWNARGSTEIEEGVSDPPEKFLGLPFTLRIGDKRVEKRKITIEGEERGEVVSEEQALGEYEVKIGDVEHRCLFSSWKSSFLG